MTTKAKHHPLTDLRVLDQFAAASFPPDYSTRSRTFYSPVDDVHGALKFIIGSATRSLDVSMYGFDDDELAELIFEKLRSEHVTVRLTLDSSQAAGVHERAILEKLKAEKFPASTIAIGQSERHAIMHMKAGVVDGVIVYKGSTNWSAGGEAKQDNEFSVDIDPLEAAILTARIGAIHANMLNAN